MSNNKDLKPCPNCGSKVAGNPGYKDAEVQLFPVIRCKKCSYYISIIGFKLSYEQLKDVWNSLPRTYLTKEDASYLIDHVCWDLILEDDTMEAIFGKLFDIVESGP